MHPRCRFALIIVLCPISHEYASTRTRLYGIRLFRQVRAQLAALVAVTSSIAHAMSPNSFNLSVLGTNPVLAAHISLTTRPALATDPARVATTH